MPNPIASPLRTSLNWLKTSHLRLVVSGILAVGFVSAVTIFAAEPDAQKSSELPLTGPAGLIVFGTFLLACVVYYGGRKYLAKRK